MIILSALPKDILLGSNNPLHSEDNHLDSEDNRRIINWGDHSVKPAFNVFAKCKEVKYFQSLELVPLEVLVPTL